MTALGGAAILLALRACSPSTPDPTAAVVEAPAALSAEGDFGATLQAALIAAKPQKGSPAAMLARAASCQAGPSGTSTCCGAVMPRQLSSEAREIAGPMMAENA